MLKPFLLLLLFLACSPAETPLTKAQVQEDIRYLQDNLSTFHPGFYRYTLQEEMDAAFTEALSSSKGTDEFGVYQKVTSLLSKVRCGHTRTRMSDEMRDVFEMRSFIPFTVKILKQGVIVHQSLDDGIKPGSQIQSINDVPISEVLATMYDHLPSDGVIESGKRRMTERLFDAYLQLFVFPESSEYRVTFTHSDGRLEWVSLAGRAMEEVNTIRSTFSGDLLSLTHFDDYSYLKIKTFGSYSLSQGGYDYEAFLEASFEDLKQQQVEHLILDLRGNGGGSDNYGALLVSYLAQGSFGYFDNIQVTPRYPGSSEFVGGSYYMTRHDGLSEWEPQENAFTGNTYVLIDGFSFSTCADVATVLHYREWATLLGEETGGGYDGNTSGHTKTITLPNSEIIVNIPMWMYTTANIGHSYEGRGAIPHYPVETTWQAMLQNQDEVLDKAIELIKKSNTD